MLVELGQVRGTAALVAREEAGAWPESGKNTVLLSWCSQGLRPTSFDQNLDCELRKIKDKGNILLSHLLGF